MELVVHFKTNNIKKASIRVIFHSETKKNCTSASSAGLLRIAFLIRNSILDTLLPLVEALELTNSELKNLKGIIRV
ncbi:hypothetical protein [Aquimarina macrocephali]|uniref:hypothetical protein n=1 Tax=Aquimarina macrocephali TaxID=666563 RepID=UPI0004B8BB76|nr:hypothetical protein [Aquimarina macrocephali]